MGSTVPIIKGEKKGLENAHNLESHTALRLKKNVKFKLFQLIASLILRILIISELKL